MKTGDQPKCWLKMLSSVVFPVPFAPVMIVVRGWKSI